MSSGFDPACVWCQRERAEVVGRAVLGWPKLSGEMAAKIEEVKEQQRQQIDAVVAGRHKGSDNIVAATEREIAESVARRHKGSEWVVTNR